MGATCSKPVHLQRLEAYCEKGGEEKLKDPVTFVKTVQEAECLNLLLEHNTFYPVLQVILKHDCLPRRVFNHTRAGGETLIFTYLQKNQCLEAGELLFQHQLLQPSHFFLNGKIPETQYPLICPEGLLPWWRNQMMSRGVNTVEGWCKLQPKMEQLARSPVFRQMAAVRGSGIYLEVLRWMSCLPWVEWNSSVSNWFTTLLSWIPNWNLEELWVEGTLYGGTLTSNLLMILDHLGLLELDFHPIWLRSDLNETLYRKLHHQKTDLSRWYRIDWSTVRADQLELLLYRTSGPIWEEMWPALNRELASGSFPLETKKYSYSQIGKGVEMKEGVEHGIQPLLSHLIQTRNLEVTAHPEIMESWIEGYESDQLLPVLEEAWPEMIQLAELEGAYHWLQKLILKLSDAELGIWYASGWQEWFHRHPEWMTSVDERVSGLISPEFQFSGTWLVEHMEQFLITPTQIQVLQSMGLPSVRGSECSFCLEREVTLFFRPCHHGICLPCFYEWRFQKKRECTECRELLHGTTIFYLSGYQEELMMRMNGTKPEGIKQQLSLSEISVEEGDLGEGDLGEEDQPKEGE